MTTTRRTLMAGWLIASFITVLPALAVDTDSDGIDDTVDNCREVPNRLQLDADADGYGNRCDVDFDQSGFADGRDVRYFTKAIRQGDPAADINEDGLVDARDPIAAIGLWGRPVGPGSEFVDDDGDGVPLELDECPASSGGGTALVRGCTAVDLTLGAPRLLIEPLVETLNTWVVKLTGPEFNAVSNEVEIETLTLDSAGLMASEGDPCGAAAVAGRAVDGLADIQDGLPALVEFHAARVAASLPAPTGVPGVDWEDQDEFVDLMLPIWEAQDAFDAIVSRAAAAAADLDTVCAQSTGPVTVQGVVESVDADRAEVKLVSGQILALANGYVVGPDPIGQPGGLLPGAQVEATGTGFADGSVVATRFNPKSIFDTPAFLALTCMKLKVIPFQLMSSYTGQPWIEHDAEAYRPDGSAALLLEEGARVTVEQGACPQPTNPLRRAVYTAGVRISGGGLTTAHVPMLAPGETVPLPEGIDSPKPYTIEIWTSRSECNLVPPFNCTAPDLSAVSYHDVVMVPRFSLCTARYSETDFPLESAPLNAFGQAQVSDAFYHLDAGNGSTPPVFSALGIPIVNGSPAAGIQEIGLGQSFAVYEGDFRDVHAAQGQPEENIDRLTGTSSRSALVWPRLVGHRNGSDFWYSCELPGLGRDLLEYCNLGPGAPNAFFTLPLDNSKMGQGPGGTFSHKGAEAWDMSAATGTPIYAARRGDVVFVRETKTGSCTTDPSDCPGNGIKIRHDDGSEAVYWHIEQYGALVGEGDKVERGQLIAYSDNTGFSTGPHLHFESKDNLTALFRTWTLTGTFPSYSIQKLTCYEPKTGDTLYRQAP